jgi:hypothetical protein
MLVGRNQIETEMRPHSDPSVLPKEARRGGGPVGVRLRAGLRQTRAMIRKSNDPEKCAADFRKGRAKNLKSDGSSAQSAAL